jgi:hypothetical protein
MTIHISDLRLVGALVLPVMVALILFPSYRKVARLYLRTMRPW